MRLIICDDYIVLAEALAAALEAHGHRVSAIVSPAANSASAISLYRPDVCLLDLYPGRQEAGLDAARAIRRHSASTKVLVLSAVTDLSVLSEAMDIGVVGLIRQNQNVEEIAHALEVIAEGGTVFDTGLRRGVARRRARRPARQPTDELTPREHEIVARITKGESTKQMAAAMNVTTGTIRSYVKNVLAKSRAHNRLQIAALASHEGTLDHASSAEVVSPANRNHAPTAEVVPLARRSEDTSRLPDATSPLGGLTGRAGISGTPAMPVRVVVVLEQRVFADALAARLRADTSVSVQAVLQSVEPARRMTAEQHADVILLDGDLPRDTILGLCAERAAGEVTARIVILSTGADAEQIVAVVRAGAAAWVRKEESIEHLIQVIQRVARGETWLPPAALGEVLQFLIGQQTERQGYDRLLAVLTPRERDVLSHLFAGAGCAEVAQCLHLSANTVRTHLQNLRSKLGVHSTLELVALARSRPDDRFQGLVVIGPGVIVSRAGLSGRCASWRRSARGCAAGSGSGLRLMSCRRAARGRAVPCSCRRWTRRPAVAA
ncbi:MAG: LuxR C-terminal-related transcriptional regulator [Streptosporangiaceae bacterium]|jgi:DNA-binding NarL/FixJ family response regulator|nr:hypothetical protein [Actinomycetota bacterium]